MKLLFENWREYLKSEILAEGGYAFRDAEGQQLTTTIRMSEVGPTLQHFSENFLKPAGIENYYPIGSTGKKSLSGDLDIVIGIGDKDMRQFKTGLIAHLQANIIAVNGQAKLVGSNIAVMYPIIGSEEDSFVQIDIMLSKKPEDAAWLMSGTGDNQIKGSYRNLLLAFIAKVDSRLGNPGEKHVIALPAGLQKKVWQDDKWANIGEKITDPNTMLRMLGIEAKADQVETFERLLDVLLKSNIYRPYLKDFPEYLESFRAPEEQKKQVIDYLLSRL